MLEKKYIMGITITNNIVEPGGSVSILSRLRVGQPRNCGPIIMTGKEFFRSPKIPRRLWGTPGILSKERVEEFKYLGTTLTNQNSIAEKLRAD